jgi:hypothetical protein
MQKHDENRRFFPPKIGLNRQKYSEHWFQDAFKDDGLAARPPALNWFNKYFRYGNGTDSRGLIFSHGPEWLEQGSILPTNLRFGRKLFG